METTKPRRFRLRIVNAAEDVPSLISAVAKMKGQQIGLIMRPPIQDTVIVRILKTEAYFWGTNKQSKSDAPKLPSKETTASGAINLIKASQSIKLPQGPITLRGRWTGHLTCDNGTPKITMRRKIATYGVLTVSSLSKSLGWQWELETTEKWFSKGGHMYGESDTLAGAITAAMGQIVGSLGTACSHKDSRRRAAFDADYSKKHPIRPAREAKDPLPRLKTPKRKIGVRSKAKTTRFGRGGVSKTGRISEIWHGSAERVAELYQSAFHGKLPADVTIFSRRNHLGHEVLTITGPGFEFAVRADDDERWTEEHIPERLTVARDRGTKRAIKSSHSYLTGLETVLFWLGLELKRLAGSPRLENVDDLIETLEKDLHRFIPDIFEIALQPGPHLAVYLQGPGPFKIIIKAAPKSTWENGKMPTKLVATKVVGKAVFTTLRGSPKIIVRKLNEWMKGNGKQLMDRHEAGDEKKAPMRKGGSGASAKAPPFHDIESIVKTFNKTFPRLSLHIVTAQIRLFQAAIIFEGPDFDLIVEPGPGETWGLSGMPKTLVARKVSGTFPFRKREGEANDVINGLFRWFTRQRKRLLEGEDSVQASLNDSIVTPPGLPEDYGLVSPGANKGEIREEEQPDAKKDQLLMSSFADAFKSALADL